MSSIYQELDQYEYISFDVFDTLLKRNVAKPTDLFRIIEEKGQEIDSSDFENFSYKRINAEKKARLITNKEITLNDIYKVMHDEYGFKSLDSAKKMEKQLELQLCCPNLDIKPIYNYCIKKGKKILIISDIYLPESLIVKMLNKIGIKKWEGLFVSSTVGLTKSQGELFQYVVKKLDILPKSIIHIGDNLNSDYKVPKRLGIDAIHISTFVDHLMYKCHTVTIGDNIMNQYMNNHIVSVPKNGKLGYETFGPLLYGMSKWLLRNLANKHISKVYFFSRDGLIIKKAFDLINSGEDIISNYLYVSRRSLQVPLLAYSDIGYKEFVNSIHWPANFSFQYFLKSLGIDDPEMQIRITSDSSFNLDTRIMHKELFTNNLLKEFFDSKSSIIKLNAEKERKNLVNYLRKNNVTGNIAIVDIGWHGNMQLNLEKILHKEHIKCKVSGFYIGIVPKENHCNVIKMSGYIFEPDKNLNVFYKETKINQMFEQIFMANHGSVRRICENGTPELYPFEQSDPNVVKLLRGYQDGALLLVKNFNMNYGKYDITSSFAIEGVLKQFLYPTVESAREWGRVTFKDISDSALISGSMDYKWYLHPIKFKHDYEESIWKEGCLKAYLKYDLDYRKFVESKPAWLKKLLSLFK